MTTSIIYGPRAADLRDPVVERAYTSFMLGLGSTDMMCCDTVIRLVHGWCDEGGDIATSCGRMLDVERAELIGEANLYDVHGDLVFLEPSVPLIRVEDSFGESPRRCVNRMRARMAQETTRRVSVANLSRLFWIGTAEKIFDAGFNA